MQKNSFNTDKEVQSLKAQPSQYYASDRLIRNLYLVVRGVKRDKSGVSKIFYFKYMFEGKSYQIKIGKYPSTSLTHARSKANELNAMLDNPEFKREGKHPQAILEQGKQKQKTFFEVGEEWLETQRQSLLFSTSSHGGDKDTGMSLKAPRDRSLSSFKKTTNDRVRNHLYPALKDKAISNITRKDLIDCIQKIQDNNTLETSKRVFYLARSIMRFALNRGYIENSILGDVDFKQTFKSPKPQHYKAITSEARFRELLLAIENYQGNPITKLALQLNSYIFLRAGNIRGLRWEYIHFHKKQIIIPSKEMKMRGEFIIPLCASAIKILQEAKYYSHASSFVFPSDISKSKRMSENTLNQAIKRLGFGEEMVFHSFRATASTILHDKTHEHKQQSEVIELCLDHKERDRVKASYNHSKRLKEREALMQWWGDYIDKLKSPQGEEYISKIKDTHGVSS